MLCEVIDMKRFLILLMTLCLLPVAAMAEEEPYRLAATVTAEQSALLSLPIGGAAEVTLRGLNYTAESVTLSPDFPSGVSNAFVHDPAEVTVHRGTVLLVWYGSPDWLIG